MMSQHEFKFPAGCRGTECQYNASWKIIGNDISFIVSAKTGEDEWIGIGFSRNQVMPQTDIIIGYFDKDGNGVIKDYYADAYTTPKEDESQDIFETNIEFKDGVTTLRFMKSIWPSEDKV